MKQIELIINNNLEKIKIYNDDLSNYKEFNKFLNKISKEIFEYLVNEEEKSKNVLEFIEFIKNYNIKINENNFFKSEYIYLKYKNNYYIPTIKNIFLNIMNIKKFIDNDILKNINTSLKEIPSSNLFLKFYLEEISHKWLNFIKTFRNDINIKEKNKTNIRRKKRATPFEAAEDNITTKKENINNKILDDLIKKNKIKDIEIDNKIMKKEKILNILFETLNKLIPNNTNLIFKIRKLGNYKSEGLHIYSKEFETFLIIIGNNSTYSLIHEIGHLYDYLNYLNDNDNNYSKIRNIIIDYFKNKININKFNDIEYKNKDYLLDDKEIIARLFEIYMIINKEKFSYLKEGININKYENYKSQNNIYFNFDSFEKEDIKLLNDFFNNFLKLDNKLFLKSEKNYLNKIYYFFNDKEYNDNNLSLKTKKSYNKLIVNIPKEEFSNIKDFIKNNINIYNVKEIIYYLRKIFLYFRGSQEDRSEVIFNIISILPKEILLKIQEEFSLNEKLNYNQELS